MFLLCGKYTGQNHNLKIADKSFKNSAVFKCLEMTPINELINLEECFLQLFSIILSKKQKFSNVQG